MDSFERQLREYLRLHLDNTSIDDLTEAISEMHWNFVANMEPRAIALDAAAKVHQGSGIDGRMVVGYATLFEAYLKGQA